MGTYWEKIKDNAALKDRFMKGILFIVIFAVTFLLFQVLNNSKDGRQQVISQDGTNVYVPDNENEIKNKEELRLENILNKISGVGKVEVMINYKKDENTTVFWSGSESEDSYEKNAIDVTGVIVVAEGGNDVVVQSKIFDAVMSVYQIPATQICVYVMRN